MYVYLLSLLGILAHIMIIVNHTANPIKNILLLRLPTLQYVNNTNISIDMAKGAR